MILPPRHALPGTDHPTGDPHHGASHATQRAIIGDLQGKNFQRTFTSPRCPIPQRFPTSFSRAVELQKQHDPNYIFEPELFNKIRTNSPYELYPGCAGLDKSCYCEEDIHCAKDHACVNAKTPGLESYKVCKPDWSKDPKKKASLVWPKYYPEKGIDLAKPGVELTKP
eukprot:GHUV01045351.1.p1 GENE.GHUV01045351.1~~GHUV01045351.1.p1  ORF type:complete len:168 (+),score=22.98 GHUV01045351.1:76-579(+)